MKPLAVVGHICNLSTLQVKQEGLEFKTILSYTVA